MYFEDIFNLLFAPATCLFCKNTVFKKQICDSCLEKIFFVYSPICIYCQKEALEGRTHIKCIRKYSPDKLITCFEYKGISRSVILQSKFGPKAFSLTINLVDYALIFKEQFNIDTIDKNFIVCPIPSDPERLKSRGFNLAEIISKRLAKKLGLRYKKLLIKNKTLLPFEKLSRNQRHKNIKDSFKIKGKSMPAKILLVDDVITTGATLMEATRCLKLNGAKTVFCFALCYRPFIDTQYQIK